MSGPLCKGDPALGRWGALVQARERQVVALEADMLGAKIARNPHALADLRARLATAVAALEAAKVSAVAGGTNA